MITKKTSFKIIIIAAAAVVLVAAAFVLYRAVNKFAQNGDDLSAEDVPVNLNVTLFKCFMGQTINENDLDEIKKALTDAVGDKILDISKGDIYFPANNNYDEDGELIDMGDGVTVTFMILSDAEKASVFSILAEKYGITADHLPEGLGRDIYRIEYDN